MCLVMLGIRDNILSQREQICKGFYVDNLENRRLYRVGMKYGGEKEEEKDIFKRRIRKLTNNEVEAIEKYKAGSYGYINKELREGREFIKEYFKKTYINLKSAINHSPKYKGQVYRGLEFDNIEKYNKFMKNAKQGNYFVDKGFLSTSTSKEISLKFAKEDIKKILFQIEAKGKNGIDINKTLELKGPASQEMEVLFNINSKFVMVDRSFIKEEDMEIEFIKLIEL